MAIHLRSLAIVCWIAVGWLDGFIINQHSLQTVDNSMYLFGTRFRLHYNRNPIATTGQSTVKLNPNALFAILDYVVLEKPLFLLAKLDPINQSTKIPEGRVEVKRASKCYVKRGHCEEANRESIKSTYHSQVPHHSKTICWPGYSRMDVNNEQQRRWLPYCTQTPDEWPVETKKLAN